MMQDQEFSFRIAAYSPDTMPMARLAEYLGQLAAILGEEKSVHFVKLEPGSTQVLHRVEREAVPKVRERAAMVRRGGGPTEARRAYRRVNRMLRQDNGSAALHDIGTGAEIIHFPGVEEVEEMFGGVRQRGAVDGKVVRIGGIKKWIPITLQQEGEIIVNCYCSQIVARELCKRLFEPVRLHGSGRWSRSDEGRWTLDHLIVDSFEALRNETLSEAIARISPHMPAWEPDDVIEVERSRSGNGAP